MIDELFARTRAALDNVDAEVVRRHSVSSADAVADGMAFAAKQIRDSLAAIESDTVEISTEQYAKLHGVTPQTVCNWIRHKELDARREGQSYLIRRSASRTPRKLQMAS